MVDLHGVAPCCHSHGDGNTSCGVREGFRAVGGARRCLGVPDPAKGCNCHWKNHHLPAELRGNLRHLSLGTPQWLKSIAAIASPGFNLALCRLVCFLVTTWTRVNFQIWLSRCCGGRLFWTSACGFLYWELANRFSSLRLDQRSREYLTRMPNQYTTRKGLTGKAPAYDFKPPFSRQFWPSLVHDLFRSPFPLRGGR